MAKRRPSPSCSPTIVTYLPGISVLGQDAYIYVAMAKGYFDQAGIQVEVQPGKGTTANLDVMLSGKATFATVDFAGALLYGKAKGGYDFKAIGSVYQRSVSTITTLDGEGITSPKDLEGKRVAYQPGGVNHTLFPAYARLSGINPGKVVWQLAPPDQLRTLLAAGQVDAVTETVIGTPAVEAAARGRKAVVLPYSDVLTDFYGNALVTAGKTIDADPELVRRFRTAAVKGLLYAIDHPDEAGEIFHRYLPSYPAATAAAETGLMASYVRADGPGAVGQFDSARVARTIALLQGMGEVPPGVQPNHVVAFDLLGPVATPVG